MEDRKFRRRLTQQMEIQNAEVLQGDALSALLDQARQLKPASPPLDTALPGAHGYQRTHQQCAHTRRPVCARLLAHAVACRPLASPGGEAPKGREDGSSPVPTPQPRRPSDLTSDRSAVRRKVPQWVLMRCLA